MARLYCWLFRHRWSKWLSDYAMTGMYRKCERCQHTEWSR